LPVPGIFVSDLGEEMERSDLALLVVGSKSSSAFLGTEEGFAGDYPQSALFKIDGASGAWVDRKGRRDRNSSPRLVRVNGKRMDFDRGAQAGPTMGAAISGPIT